MSDDSARDDADPGMTGADLPPLDPDLAAWLASDTAPAMPDAVWARLEVALAAEPPLTAASTGGAPVVDLAEHRERRRGNRLWPVLAGAAGIALVGLVVLPAVRGGGAAPVADAPVTAEAAVGLPAADGSDSATATEPPSTSDAAALASPSPGDAPVETPRALLSTGTTYSTEAGATQVGASLATAGLPDPAAIADAVSAEPIDTPMTGTGMLASPQALHDCLLKLGIPEQAHPLVVDQGTFEGNEAGLVVTVSDAGDGSSPRDLHVVIVGTECDDADIAAARHFDLPLAAAS